MEYQMLEKYIKSENKKELPIILLLDRSGSMSGTKITTLNTSVRNMIESFKNEKEAVCTFKVSIISFGDSGAKVDIPLTNVDEINYKDLSASGMTPLGGALSICNGLINDKEKISSKSLRPVVVLVSDGLPNDEYFKPLEEFTTGKRTSKCDVYALGIGHDCDRNLLTKFCRGDSEKVLSDADASKIISFFRYITISTINKSKNIQTKSMLDVIDEFTNEQEKFENEKPKFNE